MKKHSLTRCTILFLVALLSLLPAMALAAGSVAKIGTVEYATLELAAAAAQSGDTITLLQNATMDKTYFGAAAGQTLTLDLNGFTLTRTWQNYGSGDDETTKSVIYNQGTLTIKDSSTGKTGKIQGWSDTSGNTGWNQEFKGAAISNASGAVLNLQGGTVTRGDAKSFGYYTVINKGTFNMSDGLITNGSSSSAMVCNVAGGSTFNMTGGTLRQEDFQTLKNETNSFVNISGGTLESGDRTLQNYGTAVITNGTFNGDIQIPSSGNLTMSNGIVRGELFGAGKGSISGGSFDRAVPEAYCAGGFHPTGSVNGMFSVAPAAAVVPNTGDAAPVLLCGMLMLLALLGLGLLCGKRTTAC